MMKIRLFQQLKSTNSETNLIRTFKLFQNHVVNELKESKKNYYYHYFDENKSNMKMLWKGIKNIVSIKSNNLYTISYLTDKHGSQMKDPVKVANQFKIFFTSVTNDITQRIPRNKKSPLSYLTNPNQDSFFIFPSTSDEVSEVIKSLKNSKSSGLNSIPIKLLKILDPHIVIDLSILIKESFETGFFHYKLKIAKVIQVFKKGLTTIKSK